MSALQGRYAQILFPAGRDTHAPLLRQGREEGSIRDSHVLRQEGILDFPVVRMSLGDTAIETKTDSESIIDFTFAESLHTV